jgi:integrase
MALCQHVYRRGGIYWWRRRLAAEDGSCYVHVSLRVGDPNRARQIARRLGAEADRVVELVRKGMLRADQQKEILQRFIKEQAGELDRVAFNATLGSQRLGDDGEIVDQIGLRRQIEPRLSILFELLATGGSHAVVNEAVGAELKGRGVSDKDIFEIEVLLQEFGPAFANFGKGTPERLSSVGPPYEFFAGVLDEMGIASTEDAVHHARRLWMRAHAAALADVERRYGLARPNLEDFYRRVLDVEKEEFLTLNPDDAPKRPDPVEPAIPEAAIPRPSSIGHPEGGRKADAWSSPLPSAEKEAPVSITGAAEAMIEMKCDSETGEWRSQKRGQQVVFETADQYRTLAKFLVKMTGVNDARRLTQAHLVELRRLLRELPKSFGKSPKDWERPFDELIDEAKKSGKPVGRSAATVNRWVTQLGVLLEFIETYGKTGINRETLKTFRVKEDDDEEKRLAFETQELVHLLSDPVWTGKVVVHCALYWAVMIGYYEVARLSEVVGLMIDDIDCDLISPAFEFRDNAVRNVKTRNASERRVPIHPELVRLGFLEFVSTLKMRGEKMLFPELLLRAPNTALAATFDNDWTPIIDARLPDAKSQKKTFQSLRKTGNTGMIQIKVPDPLRLEICGHKQKDTNGRHYKGKIHDAVKLEAMAFIPIVTAHLQKRELRLHPLLERKSA